MSVGTNIRDCRELQGLSQKQLAEKLFVTPQAVSRWENGDVEPSLDTLTAMTKIFGVTLDQLVTSAPAEKPAAAPEATSPAPVAPTPIVPEKKLVGTCVLCGRALYEGDAYQFGHYNDYDTYSGRGHHHVTHHHVFVLGAGPNGSSLACQACLDARKAHEEEEAKLAAAKRIVDNHHRNAVAMTWGLIVGILGMAISVIIGAVNLAHGNTQTGWIALGISPVIGYGLFALLYVLIEDNTFVSDMFLDLMSFAFVKTPGIIFSFDLDGLEFLIVMKIILAILAFLFFVAVASAVLALTAFLSIFAFPFSYASRNEDRA